MLTDSQREAILARLRLERRPAAAVQIPRRPAGAGGVPLSYGQEQLWFIDRFAPGLATYNVPCAITARGALDQAALADALRRLVERHEALRTRLVSAPDGHPVQVIDPPGPVALETVTLEAAPPQAVGPDTVTPETVTPRAIAPDAVLPEAVAPQAVTPEAVAPRAVAPQARDARLRELILTAAMRPFDLAAGPLLRCALVRLAADEHLLVVVVGRGPAARPGRLVRVLGDRARRRTRRASRALRRLRGVGARSHPGQRAG
jgi:hypothetical protein